MGDGFLLDGGVDDDLAEFFLGDEFHRNCCFDGAGKELFYAFFANEFAKLDQERGVAGPAVFKVGQAREVLPGGCLAPALNQGFVALVKRVLQIQERDHQAQRQARAPSLGDAASAEHYCSRTKEVNVFNLFA